MGDERTRAAGFPGADRTPIRVALANRQLLRILVAYTASTVSEWALWVAVLVYAFERGGSATAGVAAVALLVPSGLVAPFAARASDGPNPERVLLTVYAVQAAALAATTVIAGVRAPAAAVVAVVAIAATAVTFIRPSLSVVVPGIVVRPADLVAANLLTGNADSACVLVGPLLAGAMLTLGGPTTVFATCAALSGLGSAVVWPLTRGRPAIDGCEPVAPRRVSTRELAATMRSMSRQRGSRSVLLVMGAQYALVGGLDLLYVNLSFGALDLGGAGAGYLNAVFGVGAALGGVLSAVLLARRHLAPPIVVSLAVLGLAMGGLGAWTTLAPALVALLLAGACRSLIDIGSRMLLQRSARQDVLGSVFVVLELLGAVGMLCGTLLVQAVVAWSGVRSAIVAEAVLLVVAAAVSARGVIDADERADAPVVEVRLLRLSPLFAPLPGPVLERLARTSQRIEVPAGATIVREGDPGDHYYVIADGATDVSVAGAAVRTMRRGQGFGEIALLADLPRTATVTASTPVSMLAVERADFLSAVVGHDASARVAWSVARALHPPLASDGI